MNEQNEKKSGGLNKFIDKIVSFFPIVAIVFVGLGVIALGYEFIWGVVNAFSRGGTFSNVIIGLESGIADFARYAFYAAIVAGINKLVRK